MELWGNWVKNWRKKDKKWGSNEGKKYGKSWKKFAFFGENEIFLSQEKRPLNSGTKKYMSAVIIEASAEKSEAVGPFTTPPPSGF